MSGYSILPKYYDRWQKSYGSTYSDLILPRLLASIRQHKIPCSTMLDLACGTGTLAIAMARRGWHVWGVDGSPGMLREARRKLQERAYPVRLIRQDMRKLRLPQPVQLATCLFDSLNHLDTLEGLTETFHAVFHALTDQGTFIFDVNNERCFTTLWQDTDEIILPEFTMNLINTYDAATRRACAQVTIRGVDGSEPLHETVYERYFTGKEIRGALLTAGFHVIEEQDFNFSDRDDVGSVKTWWIAQRVDGTARRP